jgi:taurine dioxygenase
MTAPLDVTRPLTGAAFGASVRLAKPLAEEMPAGLPQALADAGGLLLMPGLGEITRDPRLLVKLSYLFGPEVEDYRTLLTRVTMAHETVPEIFMVTNMVPGARPPPRQPDPPVTADGKLPVQYPHRTGWHTDQSYRRPPPDISLFYAATPVSKGSGQTIFASGHLAYDALPAGLRAQVETLEGLHAQPGSGRSRSDAEAGKALPAVLPHQRSQKQPVVRIHPVTGRKALYLCESGQMDWFDGPFVGLEPGPHGAGARLLDRLMAHYTRPEFVYVHEWTEGDVLVWDNRCLVHAATWYDAGKEQRMMWRTTVRGNPGAIYAGEKRSWIPAEAAAAE